MEELLAYRAVGFSADGFVVGFVRFRLGVGMGEMRQAYARDNNPLHVRISGESPMELQIAWKMYNPTDGLLVVARSQHAPTMRSVTKSTRKIKPALVRTPCRQTRYAAANREGKYTINSKIEMPLL